MQMTCTILHSGKQKPRYNSQKKVERKSCFLFYSTALSWVQINQGACSLHPSASLTAHLSFCWCGAEMVRWPRLREAPSYFWCFNSLLLHPAAPLCPCWSHLYTDIYSWAAQASKRCEWMAERWAACLRGCGGGGVGGVGKGCIVKGIHFIQSVCLAGWLFIWNCKSFPL